MGLNASLYLGAKNPNLSKIFNNVETDRGLFRKATFYDISEPSFNLRLNVMPKERMPEHFAGFQGYVTGLNGDADMTQLTLKLIPEIQCVLGILTEAEPEETPEVWEALTEIAAKFDGIIFAYDSIFLPNSTPILGPMVQVANEED